MRRLFLLVPPTGITPATGRLKSLASPAQARFDHWLLVRPPDVLAYANALPGSIPVGACRYSKTAAHKDCRFTIGTAYGNRTHDLAVRGPRLNLLTKAAYVSSSYLQTDFTYYILLASSWQVFFKKEMGILYDFQKYAW